jgi:hypothetical protein
MIKIIQHIPNFVDGFEPKQWNVKNINEIFNIFGDGITIKDNYILQNGWVIAHIKGEITNGHSREKESR